MGAAHEKSDLQISMFSFAVEKLFTPRIWTEFSITTFDYHLRSEVRWWDFRKHLSHFYGAVLLDSGEPDRSKKEYGVGLMLVIR